MLEKFFYFAIPFAVGLLWFRVLFLIMPHYFIQPFFRSRTHLEWHHWHYAIIILIVGAALLVAGERVTHALALLGLGLGLLVDLFVPSLNLKIRRRKALDIYRHTYRSTLFIGAFILLLFFFLSLLPPEAL